MRTVDAISDHPAVDHIPALAALGCYLGVHLAGIHVIKFPDWSAISAFHQTLVEAAAGLFGLVFAAVAILRALQPGRRLDYLHRKLSAPTTRNFRSVINALGLATAITIVAMALDTPTGQPTLARAATVWVVALVSVRMIRLIWVFGLVLDLSDRDSGSPDKSTVTSIDSQRRQAGG